jgi:hypothetical protein
LIEVIQDKENAFLHGVQERTANVLEFSEFLLADEVAQEGIEFDCTVEPKLKILRFVIFGEVVDCDDAFVG